MNKNIFKVGEIIANELLQDEYYKITFHVPAIAEQAKPGQFVHVKIAQLEHRILRRPFSICNVTDNGELMIVYKVVGEGTKVLATLQPGAVCDLMGPLGVPFTLPKEDEIPIIIAGGYGAAATYILAQRSFNKGVLLLGARGKEDLILMDAFKDAGFDVQATTEDGSFGTTGRVTILIDPILEKFKGKKLRFYGCGPRGMLMAMGSLLLEKGFDSELSLDHLMCCGVGACFACVVKVKADNDDGWRYARTCNEGPVFPASQVYYE